MSALFGNAAQLSATASGISNADWLCLGVYIKLPSDISGLAGFGLANALKIAGTSHFLRLGPRNDAGCTIEVNYASNASLLVSLSTQVWTLVLIKMPPCDGGTILREGYSSEASTDANDPEAWSNTTSATPTQSLNTITMGQTSTQDIENVRLAEAFVYSAASEATLDGAITDVLGGTRPGNVTGVTIRWYRDLVSDGSTGAGTGDLSASGTVTYDDGADHPFVVGGPAIPFIRRCLIL